MDMLSDTVMGAHGSLTGTTILFLESAWFHDR